jgi:hypothetical protein
LLECFSPGQGSRVTVNLPQTAGPFDVLFSSFQPVSPFSPVNFHQVGYLNMTFAMDFGESLTLDSIVTTVPEPSALATFCAFGALLIVGRSKQPRNAAPRAAAARNLSQN